ncbi:PKD domain-containing protein [Mycobacterium sp. 050134]|uniref:PKD domain-containing protein n=1 Tax=Mycobacterium sp. 050134 TaxID=3096111 RepID=UPI002ED79E87
MTSEENAAMTPISVKPTGAAGDDTDTSCSKRNGGTVSAGKAMSVGAKSVSRGQQTVEELLQHARQLRGAAATCRNNIDNLGWSWCTVTIAFENRTVTIEEAEAYAAELERRAWQLAMAPFSITVDKETARPNDTVTFTLEGNPVGTMSWDGDGNPATGTGDSFATTFATPGEHVVQATVTTAYGTRTSSKQVWIEAVIKEASGPAWVSRFPSSQSLDELIEKSPKTGRPFRKDVADFIAALEKGGANVPAGEIFTKRPLERQYLMYHAWRVAHGTENPADVPPWPRVDICWNHLNANGDSDEPASRAAAERMVKDYHIKSMPADPSGTGDKVPRHVEGRAVDMNISWIGDLRLDGEVVPGGTGDPEKDVINAKLLEVARRKYGLIKGGGKSDWPHWSDDGR